MHTNGHQSTRLPRVHAAMWPRDLSQQLGCRRDTRLIEEMQLDIAVRHRGGQQDEAVVIEGVGEPDKHEERGGERERGHKELAQLGRQHARMSCALRPPRLRLRLPRPPRLLRGNGSVKLPSPTRERFVRWCPG